MSEHKTHAEIIAEQLTNIESLGDELPAVIAAGSLRKLLRHLDEAHKREIEDAERRGNHEATAAICETIEKVGPLYDAESVGNSAKLRKAVEETKSTIARCMEILNKIPDSCGYGGLLDDVADELCDLREECIKDALAAPARNCDRFNSGNADLDAKMAWDAITGGMDLQFSDLTDREIAIIKESMRGFVWLFTTADESEAAK